VDGIGGTVKRTISKNIRFEKNQVTTAQEYAVLAKQLCPNIQVDFVSKSDIDHQLGFLDIKWEEVMAVPLTHRVHCVQAFGTNLVKVADASSEMDTGFKICCIHKSTDTAPTEGVQELTLTVGLWVVVEFPGEVTCIDDSDIVNIMIRAWKWPTPEDKLFYTRGRCFVHN